MDGAKGRRGMETFGNLILPNQGGVVLPSVPYYLYATAAHLIHAAEGGHPRLEQTPTETELVVGPLLTVVSMTRDELHRYLGKDLGLSPGEVKGKRYTYRATSRLGKRFPNAPLAREGESFSLRVEDMPELTPDKVQDIVRQAAHWWVLDQFDEKIDEFVAQMTTELDLTEMEAEMLNALIRRRGARLFINATQIKLKQERRAALLKLSSKLQSHFGKKMMIAEPCDLFEALRSLTDELHMPSTESILADHGSAFGDNLPVPALLLNGKLPTSTSAGLDVGQQKGRRAALRTSLAHLTEMGQLGISGAQESAAQIQAQLPRVVRSS